MKITKEDVYRSNSVNSMANCISFGTKFVACGMNQSVVLIEQTKCSAKIIEHFDGHQSIVTALTWVSEDMIVSADNSSHLILWRIDPSSGCLIYRSDPKLTSCSSPIVAVHGLKQEGHVYISCCGQSDLVLLEVTNNGTEWLDLAKKSYQPCFILAVHLIKLLDEHKSLLVASGLDDGTVVIESFSTVSWSPGQKNLVLSGHEDWITSLDTLAIANTQLYLASSSQDNSIRLWRLSIHKHNDTQIGTKGGIDSEVMSLGANEVDNDIRGLAKLRCQIDSVLAGGHENWVTRVRLATVVTEDGQGLEMVSMSMDKTVIVWRRDDHSGQWSERARLGQPGGNGLGFIGGDWARDGSLIVGISYQGDMMAWARETVSESSSGDLTESWYTVANVAGHFGPVEDLAWEPECGRFLITVSKDHSTRLHGPWKRSGDTEMEWHELGRPQLHGYEMTTVAMVTNTLMVSGADEKIARVFGMNERCQRGLLATSGHDWLVPNGEDDWVGLRRERVARDALGLSARPDLAVAAPEDTEDVPCADICVPRHDAVAADTMWPELAKLYGHAYEIWRVAAHPRSGLIATCCKATDSEHARVMVWHRGRSADDADAWTVQQRLDAFHKSTVVRMKFNKRGDRLVTVSKDRQWALWQEMRVDGEQQKQWQLAHHSRKPNQHAKVIWDVDWTPDDCCFVTVSRDKKMMLWDAETGHLVGSHLAFPDSVNAVSSLPLGAHGNLYYVFAVGLESGSISIVQLDRASLVWSVSLTFAAHHDWITRLQFAPVLRGDSENDQHRCLLASCSRDRFVKIFTITCSLDLEQ